MCCTVSPVFRKWRDSSCVLTDLPGVSSARKHQLDGCSRRGATSPRPDIPAVARNAPPPVSEAPPSDVIQSPRLLVRTLRPGGEARLQAVFDAAPDWHA